MDNPISTALLITVIGMSLVFGAIILLWAIMAILVRLAKDPIPADKSDEADAREMKLKAAAAAVGIALAQAISTEPQEFPLPPTAHVSAWQAVMRTKILSKRGPVR